MFGIANLYHGKLLIGVFFLLILCIASCYDTNKDIRKYDDAPDRDGHIHLAPFGLLVAAAVILLIALILPLDI